MNDQKFREAIKSLLLSDEGISIESEGTVYIRSLEGHLVVAGILDDEGGILIEKEFADDVETAIDYFCAERKLRNYGSVKSSSEGNKSA